MSVCIGFLYDVMPMYFHVPANVYLTFFNEQLIALDLLKNQYLIVSHRLSEILLMAVQNEFEIVKGRYLLSNNISSNCLPYDFDKSIEILKESHLLSKKHYNNPWSKCLEKKSSAGAENIDWKIDDGELDREVPVLIVLEAYYSLIRVHIILKVFGFFRLIKFIKKRNKSHFIKKNAKEFNILVTALNRACFYFPVKTKCLEWASALVFMGLKRKWKCNIEIGVQTFPFKAHAWVKVDKEIIADSQELPEELSVILSEPFLS